jgi:signal transduction histidine kinase/CheY-like chemotaxis protein
MSGDSRERAPREKALADSQGMVTGSSLLGLLCKVGLGSVVLCGAVMASIRGLDPGWWLVPLLCCVGASSAWLLLRRGLYTAAAWSWVTLHSLALFAPPALIAATSVPAGTESSGTMATLLQLSPFGAPLIILLAGVLLPPSGAVGVLGVQVLAMIVAALGSGGSVPAAHWGALAVSAVGLGVAWTVSGLLATAASSADSSYTAAVAAERALQTTREELHRVRSAHATLRARSERIGRALERDTARFEAMVQASRLGASTLDETELVAQSVEIVERHLGLSAALYLQDEQAGRVRLVAASATDSGSPLQVGEQIQVDERTLIGKCLLDRQSFAAGDVTDGTTSVGHLAASTRSEAAVPLIARDKVLGVLDVTSPEQEAFGADDLSTLSVLADAIASAIANVRTLVEVRQTVRELSRLQRRYVQEAWDRFAPQLEAAGYRYNAGQLTPLGHRPLPEVSQAAAEEKTVIEFGRGLVAPIALRGHVIGALGLEDPAGDRQWTTEDINLVESVARQMSVVLENARLVDATQRSLAEITELNRRYVRQAWEEFLPSQEPTQFVFAQPGIDRDEPLPEEVEDVLALNRPLSIVRPDDGQPESALLAPINLREQIVGALGLQEKGVAREWSEDDVALIDAVASQMSWAIENARLLAESESRAVELGHTARQLREVDQFRTQFLANMSHELRTPLNSIIGFSRVILKGIDGPLTDLQKTDLEAIHSNGQHLLAMINEILDMSKIEAGRMELVIERVDLHVLIQGVISASTALIKGRPVELRQEIQDDLPTIWADGTRIRQVITNLMSNAAKFTTQGSITFRARSDDEMVYVSVEDTGEGIPEEKVPLAFEPFRQVDGSPTRRAEGTGLGLPISKQFVEMHGGRIWLESEYGVGAKFTFCLPIEGPVEAVPELEGLQVDPQRRLLLVIADESSVLGAYRRALPGEEYQLVGLYDEGDAVRWARYLRPWAILMDLDVGRAGWRTLESLRSWRATRHCPVVVCCAAGEGARAISMGASAHLAKPVLASELRAVLSRLQR